VRYFTVTTAAIALLLPITAAFAGARANGDAARDSWKEAKPVGEARSCVPLTQIRETRVRDNQTIDFRLNNNTVLRNTLPYSCPQLGFEKRFSYSTSLSQLCSTDIITVIVGSPPQRGASCGLGKFQPITGKIR